MNALADASVHLLVLCENFAESGAVCETCDRLMQDGPRCPACGAALSPLLSLREPIIRQALAQGARVTTVAGPAADRLWAHGGVGAWTRY